MIFELSTLNSVEELLKISVLKIFKDPSDWCPFGSVLSHLCMGCINVIFIILRSLIHAPVKPHECQVVPRSIQCNLDYLDSFGHDAHMGILDKWNTCSPDNWSTYCFSPVSMCITIKWLLYITTSINTLHASMLGHKASLEMLPATSSGFSRWSPHHLPHPLCMHTSTLLESESVCIIEVST